MMRHISPKTPEVQNIQLLAKFSCWRAGWAVPQIIIIIIITTEDTLLSPHVGYMMCVASFTMLWIKWNRHGKESARRRRKKKKKESDASFNPDRDAQFQYTIVLIIPFPPLFHTEHNVGSDINDFYKPSWAEWWMGSISEWLCHQRKRATPPWVFAETAWAQWVQHWTAPPQPGAHRWVQRRTQTRYQEDRLSLKLGFER